VGHEISNSIDGAISDLAEQVDDVDAGGDDPIVETV
jgi:hypothetical protein